MDGFINSDGFEFYLGRTWFFTWVQLLRYGVLAGGFYLLFYFFLRNRYLHKKIQARFPSPLKIRTEIFYSLVTILVFSAMGTLISWLHHHGFTQVYSSISEYGWLYFVVSILLMLLLHDTYFYWTHRLMHHRKIFPYVHRVHHLSNNPTPWAAFSFHPAEAIIEAGILLLIVFIMPVHPLAVFIFLLIMTIMNVIGHLGYELYPKYFLKSKWGKWNNTSTHHNMHHRLVHCNYGLYFNFWDRWMKTNHPEYPEHFENVSGRKKGMPG